MPTKVTVVEIHQGRIEICDQDIAIYHENGDEILYWDRAEWEESEHTRVAIVNALIHAEQEGAQAVCDRIQTCLACRERKETQHP